jgi:hypothetical protein
MKNLRKLSKDEMKSIIGGDKWWRDLADAIGYVIGGLANMPETTSYEYGDEVAPGIIYGVHIRD